MIEGMSSDNVAECFFLATTMISILKPSGIMYGIDFYNLLVAPGDWRLESIDNETMITFITTVRD